MKIFDKFFYPICFGVIVLSISTTFWIFKNDILINQWLEGSSSTVKSFNAINFYSARCASCHGPNGEGGSGKSLIDSELTLTDIQNIIYKGKLEAGMPAFNGQLSQKDMAKLSEYVKAMQKGKKP